MVTWTIQVLRGKRRVYGEGNCRSSDAKPTLIEDAGIFNGSKLHELDTGKDFRFDEELNDWVEQPSSGGGGSGTGGCALAMTDVSTTGM